MVDVTTLSVVIAATSVVIGVVLAVLELRNVVKSRQTDLTMRLHSTWTKEEMVKPFLKVMNLEYEDYTDFKQKYGSFLTENPEQIALIAVINHFESMGYLMQHKMIDYGLVGLLPVGMTWEKIKPIVDGIREQFKDPKFYETFEYLYNELQK